MSRIPLTGKAYNGTSVIANAQKTINLYGEYTDDQQAPTPFTYYQTPGLDLIATPNLPAKCRCSYRTSKGTAYVVVGPTVYFLATNGALVFVGSIADRQSQVYIADNGLVVVLVDGSATGYAIDIDTNAFGTIIDPSFYGADFVVFLDTFFVFNRPATNQFYISLSNVDYALLTAGTSFDPLDIAAKSGFADPIVGIVAVHKELWLIGQLTTEVWIGTGAADFYFQLVQGAFIQHGCIGQYSIAQQDTLVFFLMQDQQGKNSVIQGEGYSINEISTPFLVNEFNGYETTSDAIGYCFQQKSHPFYVLVFPTANKTWLYELRTKEWSEWCWLNVDDGSLNRHRSNCAMFFNNQNMIGDWETGKIYALNPFTYTDDGTPIERIKTFIHMVADADRVVYNTFDADIEVGTQDPTIEVEPVVGLSWSDDRGVTYGAQVEQSLGLGGEYLSSLSWNRLGMARDRVFKLQWSAAIKVALNGGFATVKKAKT